VLFRSQPDIRRFDLIGPNTNSTRAVYVWRPATAPTGPLPTLYMADGLVGLQVALSRLYEPISAGTLAPILIVALDADPRHRVAEYVPGWENGRNRYKAHESWLIDVVLPWAEVEVGAALTSTNRAIGGFSNGGDLALSIAATHPDLFGGAIVHSPAATTRIVLPANSASVRWVFTAGSRERRRYPARLVRQANRAAQRIGAATRVCIGIWNHELAAWRDLSPGAVTWALNLGDPDEWATSLERENCVNSPVRAN